MDYKEFLEGVNREAYHEGEWQWEEDGYTVTRTYHYSPPGCHTSCGVLYYVKDGKVEFIEGDPLDPCANGKLCMRCLNRVEAINHPERMKYPMKRNPEYRGQQDKWERITWDEAFDIAEAKVREVWENYGGHSILATNGTGRNIQWQMPFFYKGILKTPNVCHIGFTGYACYLPRTCGSGAMGDIPIVDASQAHPDRYLNGEWERPEVIVVWGTEPLPANADGYLGHWLTVCVQMGSKIISVDPRLTWWGTRSEYHIQLRPGTDAALACAWLNLIMDEDLIDHEFVDKWTTGYDVIKDHIRDMTPQWAADICGVDVDDIIGAGRLFAGAKNAALQWGLAMDQQMSSMSLNLACVDLMAITGNIDIPGGWILMQNAFKVAASHDDYSVLQKPEWTANKATNHLVFGTPGEDFVHHAPSDALLQCMETGEPFPIRLWWCQSSNELSCAAMDAPRLYEAINKIPYVIYADPFMTPTAVALADLFLPVAMSAERDSARAWWTPIRSMRKVASYYEAKTDEEIIVEMGQRLDPEHFPWKTDLEFINAFLSPGVGLTEFATAGSIENKHGLVDENDTFEWYGNIRGLQENGGYAYDEFNGTYKKYEKGMLRGDGSIGFATASGRIELSPSLYKLWGLTPYPFHTEPVQSPLNTPELLEEFPLILTCGGRSFEFFHSEDRQEPTMREFHRWPYLTIHPLTAKKFDIRDGDWVWIENDHGRFRQVAKVVPTIREDTVHAEHAWWFPEQQAEDLFGTFDSNVNNCTVAHETCEGGIGSSIKSMLCKIYPYDEGDELPGSVVKNHGGWNEVIPGKSRGKQTYVEADRKERV